MRRAEQLRIIRLFLSGILLACLATLLVLASRGQGAELAEGAKIAKDLAGADAMKVVLYVAGLAIAGLVYVARFNYMIQKDFLESKVQDRESILKLNGSIKAMVRALDHHLGGTEMDQAVRGDKAEES